MEDGRLNVDKPLWDQCTFLGRFKHFFYITDVRNALLTNKQLDAAKYLVNQYRKDEQPETTTTEDIVKAKHIYESAFHPDTGARMNPIGRMSFQVPGGVFITALLLQFYKTVPQVVFFQWINQSFNALVNYTNRNAKSTTGNRQIYAAYVSATTAAVVTSVGLNALVKSFPPIVARYVPFAAVAAANTVNIPLMRQQELINGVPIFDDSGKHVGCSKRAAAMGISQVVLSRVAIAAPGMLLIPIIMSKVLEPRKLVRTPVGSTLVQASLLACSLAISVPAGCALFPQCCVIPTSYLEKDLRDSLPLSLKHVSFNKGL